VNPSRIHTEQSRVNPKGIHPGRSCEGLSATAYDRGELTGSWLSCIRCAAPLTLRSIIKVSKPASRFRSICLIFI
jgi:hypothetical protein